MTQEHPITPPSELVQQWLCDDNYPHDSSTNATISIAAGRLRNIATQAARWGADQELEWCVNYVDNAISGNKARALRAARRPKPPSLKEQAKFAAAVLRSPDETCSIAELQQHWHTICNALELVPD